MGSKYALFLGCTIPARARNYEMSARAVGKRLGIDFAEVEEFACCGFPLKAMNHEATTLLSARNLAYAEKKGVDICVLCSACASVLTEDAHRLEENRHLRDEINGRLSRVGLSYEGGVKVKHYARILYEEVGIDRIREEVCVEMKGFRFAPHFGCHYLKPSEIYEGFDSAEVPQTLHSLIAALGAESIDYLTNKLCCGGAVLAADEKTAFGMAVEKLDELGKKGADAMVLICPFCSVMYDGNQKKIEAAFESSYGLPVLYLPQLIGLAMGLNSKELGLNLNVVKAKELIQKLSPQGDPA
jgi:heterodisulfide reductase subunit B